ncbi:uncharacterized protein VP01_105g7 [Puccinia sorghi]|uniref:Uncharacterized protein n=1 Tax=Puccinia sorghi TaxID=27349 RepID=A0A0L6VTX9_9BASI|nr:uncharacterized protein VP01_105g7 [Puccinia sorghi]
MTWILNIGPQNLQQPQKQKFPQTLALSSVRSSRNWEAFVEKNLWKDKSGSTKNLHGHLSQTHLLADPNLTKKTKISLHARNFSFQDLLQLMNEAAMPLVKSISQSTIATHTQRMQEQDSLDFTQDSWTAPNVTSMMAVNSHYIDEHLIFQDLTIVVPHVTGNSSPGQKQRQHVPLPC